MTVILKLQIHVVDPNFQSWITTDVTVCNFRDFADRQIGLRYKILFKKQHQLECCELTRHCDLIYDDDSLITNRNLLRCDC